MLSDDLRSAYIDAYEAATFAEGADHSHAELSGLRAVEAAVRADERKVQIEKDAEIVDRQLPEMGPHINVSDYRHGKQSALVDAANAIRAQLTTEGEKR